VLDASFPVTCIKMHFVLSTSANKELNFNSIFKRE